MTWIVRLLLLPLLAVPVLLVAAPPSHACSCLDESFAEKLDRADAVYVGRVLDYPDERYEGDVARWLEIDRVFAGTPDRAIRVTTAQEESMCGLSGLRPGRPWLVVGTERATGVFAASSCDGSRPATPEVIAEVEELLGPGTDNSPPPVPESGPATPAPDASSIPPPFDGVDATRSEDPPGGPWPWLGGGLAFIAVVGVVAVLLDRRRPGR